MSPTSAGQILQKRPFPIVVTLFFSYFVFALFCHCSSGLHTQRLSARLSILPSAQPNELFQSQRHRRATTESLLTVEWEGIQSGDHPDSSIRGFIVEYRAEKESQWNVHSGVIPYKGPNHQYRVQIPKLPTGISYFVRIKVLGEKGEVLVETPEIRARNEVVSIKCEPDEITAPGDVDVKERGQFSVALAWQPPECGSIGEYQIELRGIGPQQFDVHRQTVAQPQASITGLLSGTEYAVRIRAVDRARIVGPWTEELVTISTKGDLPEEAQAKLDYSTDSEARISWPPLDDGRIQHYEVIQTEMDGPKEEQPEHVERIRVGPERQSAHFGELRPDTEYKVGVLAYVDHEPKKLYRLSFRTGTEPTTELDQKPVVTPGIDGAEYEVHWKSQPELASKIDRYIVEYRPGNETKWRKLTEQIATKTGGHQTAHSVKAHELKDAFSVRVLFLEGEKVVAKTAEGLVKHRASGNSCERVAPGEPKVTEGKEGGSGDELEFSWEKAECEGRIEGWEYSIWPAEDGQPPESTSFSSRPQVVVKQLEPSTEYRFRVRHRLLHGHGPWSPMAIGRTGHAEGEGEGQPLENIYRLRVVLSPPRSFLLWTPLPEHRRKILRFKVSHKPTAQPSEWTSVEGPPDQFACPPGLAQPDTDFCLDLQGLDLGRQYSAEVVYQVEGGHGKWSRKGSPLFFILVQDEEESGEHGPLKFGQIRLEPLESGTKTAVHWRTEGHGMDQVRAYQLEIRGGPEQPWRPASGYVGPERHDQREFRTEIDSALLAGPAEIRIRAVGADGKPVAMSTPIDASTPCELINEAPKEVSLTKISANLLLLRWSFPSPADQSAIDQCHLHFLVGGILNGASFQRMVDGRARELRLEGGHARLSVHAVNRLGAGPASVPVASGDGMAIGGEKTDQPNRRQRRSIAAAAPHHALKHLHKKRTRRTGRICDPRTDFWCRPDSYSVDDMDGPSRRRVLVSTPTVKTTSDGSLEVEWRSQGNGRGVFGYRVLYRPPGGGWNPYGQIVPYVGEDEEYSQHLEGLSLGVPYEVQIQALDRNSYVLFTSPEVRSTGNCLPPTQPPAQVAIDAPDAGHVRVTWAQLAQSAWLCGQAQVEIQVDEPRGKPPAILDARQSSHVFDAAPGQRWSIRARTRNEAGQSPWSASVSVSTLSSAQSLAEPIDGPFVSFAQGQPRLSWRGREGADPELVDHFVVEWRRRTEPRWNQIGRKIPFTGWQRPYNADLDQLEAGHVYEVRVRAIDHNLGTAFLSGTITVQPQAQCQPPRSAPRGVQTSPLGPTQLRLSWLPLVQSEWNCDQLWYVVKYSSAEQQGFRNLTAGEHSAIFDSAPFTEWHFQVQAANPAGASPWSGAHSGQTLTTAPGPVAELAAETLAPDAVQLSWRPPQIPNGQIMGYELVSRGMCPPQNGAGAGGLSTQTSGEGAPMTVMAEKPSFTLQQLHPHSRYRIGVAARTETGAGERVTREVQTDQSAPTAPPANFRVDNVAEQSAELSWHAPPCVHTNGDITEYEYEIAAADRLSAQIPRLTDVTRSTRVHLTGLLPSTSYTARVRAFTARGAGPWSQDLRFKTLPAAIRDNMPQPRVYATGPREAQLVWQTSQNQANYYDKFACSWAPAGTPQYQEERVFPAYNPCEMAVIQRYQLPPTTTHLQTHCGQIRLREEPAVYDYKVRAKPRNEQWTQWSPPQRPIVVQPPPPPRPPPRPPPPAPAIIDECIAILGLQKQGGSPNALRFGWTVRPSDLLRCTAFIVSVTPRDGREPARQFRVDGSTSQYLVDGLRPATTYAVSVQPVVNDRPCPGITVDMTTDPEPLIQLQRPRIVEERATSITIAWDVPSSVQCSSFMVEYRLENGPWMQMAQRVPCTGRSTYTATVPDLPTNSGVDLRYRLISVQNQPSGPSPEVRGHTKCSPPESPPHGLRLDAPSRNEVRLSWARLAKSMWNCDELNIDIGYRMGDQPERVMTVPGDKVEHIFASEPNTRWTVRLRATNQAGSSQWGPEQTLVTPQGAPGHVLNLQLTPLSPNEIRVRWQPPTVQRGTIVGYDISYRLKHRLACPEEEPRDVSRDFVTIYNYKDTEYTLTGLLPNSLYEVKVRARTTELGPEETREGATLQQPPSAPPLNLQLTYALERSLSFQWEPVECSQRHGTILAYEYEIIGQDDWAKLERQIANTSQTRVTIDGLTPYTKYVFRVRAYNGVGGGPATENLDVMTAKANAPLPPQDLVVTQEGVSWFTVSWLPPYPPYGPHDRYKLQYQLFSANPNDWQTIEVDARSRELECPVPGPRLCYNITNLDQGQQYRVKVAAHIEGGSFGPFSNIVIANTLRVLPGAPASIQLIAKTDHSLHVGWRPPQDPHQQITQYRLSWQSMAQPDAQRFSKLIDHPKMDHLIDGLEPETMYNISLSAGSPHGFGPEIWAQFKTDPFKVPAVLQAPIVTPEGAHTLHVEWTGVVDTQNRVAGYIVEIRTSDTNQWTEATGVVRHEPARRTYRTRLDGLEPDTLYFVRIKVVDNNQRISEPSPEAHARTGCAPPTSPPSGIALHSTDWRQVRVTWQPPGKQSWLCSSISYEIEYRNGSQPTRVQDVPSHLNDNSFPSGPSTEWVVRMRTKNPAGQSPWSPPVTLTTKGGPPGAVKDLRADATGPTTVLATWTPPEADDEITGYTLVYTLRSIGECGPASAKPITKYSREPRLELDGLLPDSTYDIYVTAHTTQAGPKSSVVTVRTEESEPTGQPKNVRVTSVTATRAELLWNEIECEQRHGKILGYDYELDDLSGEGNNQTKESSGHRVSLDDLTPYTEYRARVRGKNSKGEGPFSDYVQFRTLPAAPPPPTDLREEEQLAHALEISFLPPHPPNGILDQYRIRWTLHGKFNYQEKRVPAFQLECSSPKLRGRLCYRVPGLEPEQEYLIQAAAHTEHGDWSEWSEPLITSTVAQDIPDGIPLELDFVKSTSIGVRWRGLEEKDAEHIVGYVLEYKSENDPDWMEWNGVVRHRARQPEYKAVVKGLTESTEYFFRLKVVGKNDKRGGPGPELKAVTKCGKPEQPPSNVRIENVDFQQVRIQWESPEEETWKCDQVELALHYTNSRGQTKTVTFPPDGPREVVLDSVPGTRWEAKMRTQTVEPGKEPKFSGWSPRAVLTTKSLPDQIFLNVTPKGPTQCEAIWDLPEGYQDWPWGVDLQYRLVRLGGCKKFDKALGEPVIMENVQDKQVLLDNLYPGSEYEVTVTLRQPPGFDKRIPPKKAVQRFQTEDQNPTGPPTKLRVEGRWDTKLAFGWEPPECLEQNGEISQYEYELTGQDEWNQGTREGVTPRQRADIGELMPGSLYRFKVRAFTSTGPGPWSEPIDARTTGSEIGPPRDLTAVDTTDTSIQLAWLPPHPETSTIVAYRLKYGPSSDSTRSQEMILKADDLTCSGYQSSILTADHLCTTVEGLKPASTYRFAVQAQAASGNWGPYTSDYFATTRPEWRQHEGGSLRLLSAGHDNLRVKWTPPGVIGDNIDQYEVFITVANTADPNPRRYETPGTQTDFHFKGLEPVTLYNVTVRGMQQGKSLWLISANFPTTDIRETLLDWLGMACTEVRLIEKSDTMLHASWTPPDIFEPEFRDLHTHYRVTIAPVGDEYSSSRMGQQRQNYTVMVPGNSIRFTDLQPETAYNVTVQAGTDVGYGQMSWGIWETLAPGRTWILRLKSKTPSTLTVEWDPVWGFAHSGYMLTAKLIHSPSHHVRLNSIKSFDVPPTATEYTIRGLDSTSTYNVTLSLKDQMDGASAIYSTMLPGCNLPGNLNHCDQTQHATSMSWEPVEGGGSDTHYQVRYIHLHSTRTLWVEEPEKHRKYLLCPKDPCNRLCYLVFNLPHPPEEYAFMVRARVDGIWNNWKLAGRPTIADPPEVKENCCIVPPPYHVENIGMHGTTWDVPVAPSPTQKNITRYYVVVDERDPPGDTNWTQLTDKVTANRLHIPYYVTGSFSTETLTTPTTVRIGDGQVLGGYLNYPLVRGKTYNYEIYTKWMMHGDQPVIARLRATPFLSAGWPWWWLLLLLLLLLLCILLCCLLLYFLQRRHRRRRYVNGQHEPLIKEKYERYEHSRGDFEDGYARGFRAARGGRHEDYRGRDEAFREGYAKGLRDSGERGMSTSMSNLAQRPTQRQGYSSGYMQGFRDGNSGVFGDRISESLLRRLEDQYPDNEEFRAGYIDGFKDGVNGGRTFEDSRRVQQSLTELTERLTTIEKTVEKGGDEVHSTKIYHVYNQSPEMVAQGQQLVSELEELASGSRRSTLRRHYTPGDYLRYEEGMAQGGLAEYNSLGRSRRSMSASALGRGELLDRQRHHSGASLEGGGHQGEIVHESYSRSTTSRQQQGGHRAEMGMASPPRRYASQTVLDGARPGPTTSQHSRRSDALQKLQSELDSLSGRSPAGSAQHQTPHIQHHQHSEMARSYEYESAPVPVTTTTHQWPEDLMEIVHEPMGQTLDRMRRYSTSLSNVERAEGAAASAAAAESEKVDHQEKYKRTYREEYSGGGAERR